MSTLGTSRREADLAIARASVLNEATRGRMFTFVRLAGRPVTRDEAAARAGISRKLAAFHLDKLVEAGLLVAGYDESGERRVGRRPKVYWTSGTTIHLSIPERRPDVLAELLLEAVLAARGTETARQAALRVAGERGRRAGQSERERGKLGRLGAERALTACERVLGDAGFEPLRDSPLSLRLRNCPFQPHTAQAGELVCGMNRAYLTGLIDGLAATDVQAASSADDGCCVRLQGGTA